MLLLTLVSSLKRKQNKLKKNEIKVIKKKISQIV